MRLRAVGLREGCVWCALAVVLVAAEAHGRPSMGRAGGGAGGGGGGGGGGRDDY